VSNFSTSLLKRSSNILLLIYRTFKMAVRISITEIIQGAAEKKTTEEKILP
jgi:hypothetical protein